MKEDLPEKQGLKPPLIIIRDIISKHERGSSRKTRIETPAPPSPVREVSGMKEDLPEKQGLKQQKGRKKNNIWRNERGSSRKTRIETRVPNARRGGFQ